MLQELADKVPTDWLKQHWPQYLELLEKVTYSLIQLQAGRLGFDKLESEEDFKTFFESEGERLGHSISEIKEFFTQAAAQRAKEQVFEENFGDLVPRDEQGRGLIAQKDLAAFVGGYGDKWLVFYI